MTFEELRKEVDQIVETYRMNPDLIAELIAFKAQFYKYSLNNTMAIKHQNRHATFVASYLDWRKMGYSVKRGENGMHIWVPVITKTFERSPEEPRVRISDATHDEKVKIASGQIPLQQHLSFKGGYVFDISQTTCPAEDYPKVYSVGYDNLQHGQLYDSLKAFAQKSGFSVEEKNLTSIALGGYCRPDTDEIVISDILKDSRKLSVLCHEFAHGLMHKTSTQPKEVIEFEAEALAIMMLSRFGLPVEDSNRSYVTSYYKEIDLEQYRLEDSFARIQRAYNYIVSGFEEEILKLTPEVNIAEELQSNQQQEITANFLKDLS